MSSLPPVPAISDTEGTFCPDTQNTMAHHLHAVLGGKLAAEMLCRPANSVGVQIGLVRDGGFVLSFEGREVLTAHGQRIVDLQIEAGDSVRDSVLAFCFGEGADPPQFHVDSASNCKGWNWCCGDEGVPWTPEGIEAFCNDVIRVASGIVHAADKGERIPLCQHQS